MDKPALANGPAKRTLSNTVAWLAVILDLLARIVARIESTGDPGVRAAIDIRPDRLNKGAADVMACEQTATSSQDINNMLLLRINLAEDTIEQLRKGFAPPSGKRKSNVFIKVFIVPVRRLFRVPRPITYDDFVHESSQILDWLSTTREWVRATLPQSQPHADPLVADSPQAGTPWPTVITGPVDEAVVREQGAGPVVYVGMMQYNAPIIASPTQEDHDAAAAGAPVADAPSLPPTPHSADTPVREMAHTKSYLPYGPSMNSMNRGREPLTPTSGSPEPPADQASETGGC